jgi:hypothetical protein
MEISSFFNYLNNLEEERVINDFHIIHYSNSSFLFPQVIIKVNLVYWLFHTNADTDEIEVQILPEFITHKNDTIKHNFTFQVNNFAIGTVYAIVNERGYTDGVKFSIYDRNSLKNNKFHGVLTLFSLSGIKYRFEHNSIDQCFLG